jgi:hypothetical protein
VEENKPSLQPLSAISRREVLKSLGALGATTLLPSSSIFATPVKQKVRFAVLGDWGIGTVGQLAVAQQMLLAHKKAAYDFVITVGDNIYPYGNGKLFPLLFERPYQGLLQQKVKFYATLGNHDVIQGRQDQLQYPLFNMNNRNYYSLARGEGLVEIFMLDTNFYDNAQAAWLEKALSQSKALWKIAAFHHPLYSSARHHGSDYGLRKVLEPLFVKYKVNVVLAGHDHTYERVKVQQGIRHFVTGGGGACRPGDIVINSPFRESSLDQINHFMLVEVSDKGIAFQTITEQGDLYDSGLIREAGIIKPLA